MQEVARFVYLLCMTLCAVGVIIFGYLAVGQLWREYVRLPPSKKE